MSHRPIVRLYYSFIVYLHKNIAINEILVFGLYITLSSPCYDNSACDLVECALDTNCIHSSSFISLLPLSLKKRYKTWIAITATPLLVMVQKL